MKNETVTMSSRIFTFCCLFGVLLLCPRAHAKEYKLYYLGGQSNMDGYGFIAELPRDLQGPVDGVMIFHGNTVPDAVPVDGRGIWTVLQPGHGVKFVSDGKTNTYSDRFGPELTFARRMKELDPSANIAIIKYSRGGTALDRNAKAPNGSWDPDFDAGQGPGKGVNQYDHFLATLRNAAAVRDIDGDGEADTLVPTGIVWMQGESDGHPSIEIAERYEANLKRMIGLIRAALSADGLPVVIGRVVASSKDALPYIDSVRAAQEKFVAADARAALVTSTDGYKFQDRFHYDTAGFLDLGRSFADAMFRLQAAK